MFARNQGGPDNWGEVKKLTAADAAAVDDFGNSVAISGGTAVVGAFLADAPGANSGAIYVFERNFDPSNPGIPLADNWGEVKKLTASDGAPNHSLGTSVAISGDLLVAGAPRGFGSAYIFERNFDPANPGTPLADNWGELRKLTASDGANGDDFGGSVALSVDTVVVGAEFDSDAGSSSGSAYVFERNFDPANPGTPLAGNWGGGTEAHGFERRCRGLLWQGRRHRGRVHRHRSPGEDTGGFGAGAAYVFRRTCSVPTVPDLQLTKVDGGATGVPGGTVSYTLTYDNVGGDATGVEITDTVPADTTFDPAASTPGWVCAPDSGAGSVCALAIGSLGGGGGGTATFAVTIDNPLPSGVDQISNSAAIADDGANGADPNPGDNTDGDTTPVDAAPDLAIVKDDGGALPPPGGTVSYTLAYTNTGNQDATGVELTDTVPDNTTFDSGASSPGWACVPDDNPGSVCTLAIGSLGGAGGAGLATFAVIVDNPLAAGVDQISNTASISDDGANGADPNPGDNSDSDTTPMDAAPDLAIAKNDGGALPLPGGTLAYTLTYANNGNQDATGVELTDTVPDNTTFDAGASTAGWACVPDNNPGSVCTVAVGALAGGGSGGAATFAVDLDSPLPPSLPAITNTAAVADDGANGADPNPGDNSSTVITDATPPTVANIDTVADTGDGRLGECETARVNISRVLATFSEAVRIRPATPIPTTSPTRPTTCWWAPVPTRRSTPWPAAR